MLRRLRGLSLAVRLPMWLSLLLVAIIVMLAGLAYREVRRAALAGARARLDAVTTQLATSNVEGYRRRLAAFAAATRNDSLTAYAANPAPALAPRARRVLESLAADTAQVNGVQLLGRDGAVLLAAGDTAFMRGVPRPPARDTVFNGPLVTRDTSVAYATAGPLRRDGAAVGTLVQWRKIAMSARGREAIAQIIGLGAEVYLGNPEGDVWVNLAGQRAEPPPAELVRQRSGELVRGGETQLAAVQPIAGTPWLMEVDFPRSAVLQGTSAFLRRFLLAAGVLLLAGIVLGWLASRRIVRPLLDLTTAAESVAAGDFSKAVNDDAGDEAGRLARAFNAMATQVQEKQQELESRVAQRTRELHAALVALEEAQDELVRKERLAMLGQLSSSVGHELRNPLGVMNNAVYYLEAVLTDIPPTAREYLGILRNQIGISTKIVADLMDFARTRRPDRRVVPLQSLIAEQLAALPHAPNITIRRELAPDVPAVFADPVHVEQILRNLTMNAVQAMEGSGGTLTVRTGHDGPGNVRIEVADTGPGIAPENLDKVFEPLFTTRARGIGLGLAVSRTLAGANGGTLTVASRPGAGATFTLTLPMGGAA